MNKLCSLLLIMGVLLLATTDAMAQKRIYNFEHYGIEEGISQSIITDAFIDTQGFIWLGTQDGLNKYDGYDFITYRHEPLDDKSLSSNYVRMITEDSEGLIWVATQSGLSIYNRLTDSFERINTNENNINSLSSDDVYYVFEDSEGYIWIKTHNGIDRYDKKNKKFTYFEHYNDLFSYIIDYNNFSIIEDNEKNLWVATKDGLTHFDRKHGQFKRYYHEFGAKGSICENQIRSLCIDKKGDLWVGTQNGLSKFNEKSLQFENYFHQTKEGFVVNYIFQPDDENQLLLATKKGVFIFDKIKLTLKPFRGVNQKLNFNKVNKIIVDKSDILWLATDNGLYKADQKPKKFNVISKTEPGYQQLNSDHIMSIQIDDKRNLWLATRRSGLNKINLETGKLETFSVETGDLPNNEITVIHIDTNNILWVGTSNGLVFYDEKLRTFRNYNNYFHLPENKHNFNFNRIYDIAEDTENNFWVATQNGLRKINKDTIVSYFFDPYNKKSLSSNEVFCLLNKTDSTFWIGTLKGLNLYNKKTDNFTVFRKTKKASEGPSNNSILSLFEAKDGTFWVGTESGLNKFDYINDNFTFYTQRDGFVNDYIYSIQEDDDQNLWVSTNRGLSSFNPHSQSVTNYDLDDGLQHFEFNIGSSFNDTLTHNLYFGGIKGVNVFNPENISKNIYVPPVVITNIKKLGTQGKKAIHLDSTNTINLYPEDINVTIQFSTLEYTNPLRNQYVYKLEGLDNEWVEVEGDKHSATYSKLPAGDYIFKVIGSNSDFIWSPVSTQVFLKVHPPIWKTTWAYLIYFVLSLGFLFLVIHMITRNLRRANNELLEKNKMSRKVEKQKEELAIVNQNIMDSLNYAKRIIEALLPSENYFKSLLPKSFILYKPKDIVSGDFYWISQKKGKIFFTAVDCTGHGVPGAFMSIIGIDLLRKIIINSGVEEPQEILNRLNEEVENTFDNNESDHVLKDGMDLAFCVYDPKTQVMEYAGAINPLYLLRDDNIIEIEPNRFSVGVSEVNQTKIFTKQTIQLQKDDMLYIFSDGYTDQFGGPKEKKFKYRRFRHLLLTIHKFEPQKQKEILNQSIENWRGSLEQVDDILIIGLKV